MNAPLAVERYGAVAQLAHWLTALLLVGGFSIGFYMVGLEVSPARLKLYSYHKWIGVTVFLVVALRLAWRLAHRPPALPPLPAWERRAAQITHRLLYLLLLAVPLTGWLMSSAKGFQTVWFGVLPLPNLLDKNPPLGAALQEVHWALNKMLLGLVGLHVAAALKHYFIDRDQVLQRMLPALVLLLLVGGVAAAAPRALVPGGSEIAFTVKQMGVPVTGRFQRFAARIDLDPAHPETGSAEITVDVTSLITGDDEADATAKDRPWLDAAAFPKATFASRAVKALAPGRFEAVGTLTLRGKAREVRVPFAVATQPDGSLTASGTLAVQRTDFAIGGGEWNEGELVANAVEIRFRLALAPATRPETPIPPPEK